MQLKTTQSRNWTIGKRMATGFMVVIAILTALGIYAGARLTVIRHQTAYVAATSIPGLRLSGQMERTSKELLALAYKHLGSTDPEAKRSIEADIQAGRDRNNEAAKALDALLKGSPQGTELLARMRAEQGAFRQTREEVLSCSRAGTNQAAVYELARTKLEPACAQYAQALHNLAAFCTEQAAQSSRAIEQAAWHSQLGLGLGVGLAILAALGITWAIVRGTNRLLGQVALNLDESAGQVAAAATEVAASSQSLAEGASEQAASLEETSASLEEMASMVRRTAENAANANALARAARAAADGGTQDMNSMAAAMQALQTSGDEIAKIIKTIDEIAFQTNILALNAAVEAARAGEAGMGFAVVADEVRSLAQRSAQAAKETAAKIESAIASTTQGVQLNHKVALTLQDIVTKVHKVDGLVAEVAAASQEQSQGTSQVNTAMSQMDQVTQRTAASAEESASAAEELSAQAQAMKEAVGELRRLVGLVNHTSPSAPRGSAGPKPQAQKPAAPRPVFAGARRPGLAADPSRPQPELAEPLTF